MINVVPAYAQTNAFVGKWNITGDPPNQANVYWLEVKDEGGTVSAMFLNRGGSPVPGTEVKIANGELWFKLPGGRASTRGALRAADGKLTGTVGTSANSVKVTGVRPPQWAACDANASHTFGKRSRCLTVRRWPPGASSSRTSRGSGPSNGAMTNKPPANNLVSKEKFQNFKSKRNNKLSPKSNSGIYLRGRYEMQVLDDAGAAPEAHGHMAIYRTRAECQRQQARRRMADHAKHDRRESRDGRAERSDGAQQLED